MIREAETELTAVLLLEEWHCDGHMDEINNKTLTLLSFQQCTAQVSKLV